MLFYQDEKTANNRPGQHSVHFCRNEVETTHDTFFICSRVMAIWEKVHRWWNFPFSSFSSIAAVMDGIDSSRLSKDSQMGVEAIFMITCFSLWRFRNKTLFDKSVPRLSDVLDFIVEFSFRWMCYRCKGSRRNFTEWSSSPSNCIRSL